MIGHFLATLTEAGEDLALTESFEPYAGGGDRRCLVDVVRGLPAGASEAKYFPFQPGAEWFQCGLAVVGRTYDQLCRRFGAPRVNAAIRSRILSNRARRVLSGVPTPQEQPQP